MIKNEVTEALLARVQRRRMWPTRMTQWMQVAIQNRIIKPVLAATEELKPPWQLRLLESCSWLRRFPARFIGLGFRPEHACGLIRQRS